MAGGRRGGGQKFNIGTIDLNQLSAYFLEKSRNNLQAVKDIIDRNRQEQQNETLRLKQHVPSRVAGAARPLTPTPPV